MKKKNHKLYYFSLTLLMSFSFVLLISTGFSRYIQTLIAVLTGILYVIFGISHHFFDHDLHRKIVVEYILIACIGVAAVFFLLRI